MANQDLYAQDTEFVLLNTLVSAITKKTFIDIGAEKGSFSKFFMQKGLQGILFEPCPKHHAALKALTKNTKTLFFPYAIDSRDRTADLHLSYDENGELQDYFHSLHALPDDPRVKHQDEIPVTCRSLQSLVAEGVLEPRVGMLKIDTEGNDLNVLKGMGTLHVEVLICKFFTEGLYAGWEEAHPRGLIAEAEKLGLKHYLAIIKRQGRERLAWTPTDFFEQQWGNLIFMNAEIYECCFEELNAQITARQIAAADAGPQPVPCQAAGLPQRLTSLHDWLSHQWDRHAVSTHGTLLIDVGAYQGGFSRELLASSGFENAVLFEPNPLNVATLKQAFAYDGRLVIEPLALGNEVAEVTFYATDDRATGSVLPYAPASLAPDDAVESYCVEQTTLDRYLEARDAQERVGLIKIDTQGYDLQVLQGAEQTLKKSQPWLVAELIFGPLYQHQASPFAIFNWLTERGYSLAALFNEHFSDDGWIAFADAVFVPGNVAHHYEAPYHARPDLASLQYEIQSLRAICAERLELINFLHTENAKRLELIEQLENELRAQDLN